MSAITYNFQRENSIGTNLLVSAAAIALTFAPTLQVNEFPQDKVSNLYPIRQEYGSDLGTYYPLIEYNNIILPKKDGLAMNEKRITNLKKLDGFSKYPSNWNGYGASAISSKLISKMKGLVLVLNYQPDIFPTARDSIQFEYEKKDGSYLEFELFDDKLQMYSIDSGGTENTSLLDFSLDNINKVVNNFYECHI